MLIFFDVVMRKFVGLQVRIDFFVLHDDEMRSDLKGNRHWHRTLATAFTTASSLGFTLSSFINLNAAFVYYSLALSPSISRASPLSSSFYHSSELRTLQDLSIIALIVHRNPVDVVFRCVLASL